MSFLPGVLWAAGTLLSLTLLGFLSCCCGGSSQQQQQQQQIVMGEDNEPKRVCPECGLENPRDADYCGDCGFSFTREGETDGG